ncbi:MAG: hypothetical protein Q9M31_10065 [Mariprofundus sp.]|nr:hypothetical protein [Mariprofundus sp.]
MKAEHGVMMTGAVGIAALVLAIVVTDDSALDTGSPDTAAVQQSSPLVPQLAPPSSRRTQQNQAGMTAPAAWGRTVAAGMVPFHTAATERFDGNIQKVFIRGAGTEWAQMHIWVVSGMFSASTEISLAPQWYLEHLGCSVSEGSVIHGSAFNFFQTRPELTFLYGKTITINGVSCELRNAEGLALWSNQLSNTATPTR